jgi:hypothetical protein
MGMSASAHLAYGYDLGSGEDFKAAERGEYGEPKLPWLPTDEDGDCDYSDFGEEVEKRLLASVGFTEEWAPGNEGHWDRKRDAEKRVGVELTYSGHSDYSGWVLIAKDSERSVEWAESMPVDLGELTNRPRYEGWDTKLDDALKALGITPTQVRAKWLVYPSYG